MIQFAWLKSLILGNLGEKKRVYRKLLKLAEKQGINLASSKELYQRRKRLGESMVIPAFNLRGLTFELAEGIFQAAKELKTDFFIFEIARSELNYTQQHPYGYAGLILAAALNSAWQKSVYLQADHLQINPERYGHTLIKEIHLVKKLLKAYLKAGFLSLDLDCSALNNLQEKTPALLLKANLKASLKLLRYLNLLKVSEKLAVGLEVGEIGSRSTTLEELRWFLENLKAKAPNSPVVKIAVQTGTTHGGKVNAQGELETMTVDFKRLRELNKLAQAYGFYGVVQHGASTLPLSVLRQLPETGILEVHLGTAFQNLIFDHPDFPPSLKIKIYQWLEEKFASRLKAGQTKAQFYYEFRKQSWSEFKKEFLALPESFKKEISASMKKKTKEIFKALKIS
jgi:fructose/tagatose bisphosphate aldolase